VCTHAAVSFGKYSVLDQIHLEMLEHLWIEDNEGRSAFPTEEHLYFLKGNDVKIEIIKSTTDLFGAEFDESADE